MAFNYTEIKKNLPRWLLGDANWRRTLAVAGLTRQELDQVAWFLEGNPIERHLGSCVLAFYLQGAREAA